MIASEAVIPETLNGRRLIPGIGKFILFSFLLVAFLLHHSLMYIFIWDEARRYRYILKSIQFTSFVGLKILNVSVRRTGARKLGQGLIVANHISYLDVLILSKEAPALFVTSTEIRDTFLLGHICKLAGCFFVERRRERRSCETKEIELRDMKEMFRLGFNVFLFPEGTSSNGKQVLAFKGTFFQLAVDTETAVRPMCLKYSGVNADVVPWFGDMTFPDHLFRLCLQKKLCAHVHVLDEVYDTEKMKLAKRCHENIAEVYSHDPSSWCSL